MDEKKNTPAAAGFMQELTESWNQLPNKGMFLLLLVAWLLFFQFLGNATFGYVNTPSLMGWMSNAYSNDNSDGEDAHGPFVPLVVLALFWWKRKELLSLPNRSWWPGLAIMAFALALHVFGYLVQQPRISIVALFLGIYGLMGLAWGPQWLKKSFFPFFLLGFCIPISSIGQPVTVPLRIMAAKIVVFLSNDVLAMNVIREGTQLYNSSKTYRFDVAAACSGIRSLVAIIALSTIFAFMNFDRIWKRLAMIALAIPLAVLGNVTRLMLIILVAELGGQDAGNFVHKNWFFSMIPYVPAILGIVLLGHWMREPAPSDGPINLKPKAA